MNRTYRITRINSRIACLVHKDGEEGEARIAPQGAICSWFDYIGNGALELSLAILVDYFNEIRCSDRWLHVKRKTLSYRWYRAFFFEELDPAFRDAAISIITGNDSVVLTEKRIKEWVDEKKFEEVDKRFA